MNQPNSLHDQILQRIKQENIKPKSVWYFRLRNVFFWSIFIGSIVIGTVAMALIIYAFNESGLETEQSQFWLLLIRIVPYTWLLILCILFGTAFLGMKYTPKGYKVTLNTVLMFSLGASLFFGSCIYFAGGSVIIDYYIRESLPVYEPIIVKKQQLWTETDHGRLSGEIITLSPTYGWIKTWDGQHWRVPLTKAAIPTELTLQVGSRIKIAGQATEPRVFEAYLITEWEDNPWDRLEVDLPPEEANIASEAVPIEILEIEE